MGGINEVLGLQASTGLNAQAQAKSIDSMRASSGYAYSTSDLTSMTKSMAGPEATNQMFMMMGTGMYGIGGTQRTQQQVFQDVIKRTGLTDSATLKGAFQQGSTVRARLAASGLTEDQIDPLLQYAQQNVAYKEKGGKGFYDPSQKSQRKFMGVEDNFASQAEETDRVKANREENFYKRQNDNFAQMEKNVQAVNKALQAFEEKLSGVIGARVSTKSSMVKGALKWGAAAVVGTAVGIAMIDEIGYKDLIIKLPEPNPVSVEVNNLLNDIKTQKIEDPFGLDDNDLPTDEMAARIEGIVHTILMKESV
jgi:hypothetical protein